MCKMAHFGNCDPETADQEYCIFHKPDKSEEEAVEFYRKFLERFKPRVEEIEVEGQKIKRLVFEEPVNARGFVFPDVPNRSIEIPTKNGNKWKFCDRELNSECLDFRGAVFKEDVRFDHAVFRNIPFYGATFEKEAHFSNSQIFSLYRLMFRKTHFKGRVYFKDATLKNVWFQLAVFSGRAEFNGATLIDVSFDSSPI